MVDYFVDADEVLGSGYYVTSLECDNYNPNIGSTVDVTVTVVDVYGDPVVGEVVTVTASAGNFNALDGYSITDTDTIDGTTDASGQFTLSYACSVWGLIDISANNVFKQVNVTGFKKIAENTTYTLRVDESQRCCQIEAHRTGVTITSGHSFSGYSDFVIPAKYYPRKNCYSLIMRNVTFLFWVFNNGAYGVTNLGNAVNGYDLAFIHEWHY